MIKKLRQWEREADAMHPNVSCSSQPHFSLSFILNKSHEPTSVTCAIKTTIAIVSMGLLAWQGAPQRRSEPKREKSMIDPKLRTIHSLPHAHGNSTRMVVHGGPWIDPWWSRMITPPPKWLDFDPDWGVGTPSPPLAKCTIGHGTTLIDVDGKKAVPYLFWTS